MIPFKVGAHDSFFERPVTFDNQVAAAHDDVVLAHLGHRLVQQAKAAAREERNADHALVGARRPLTSWFRPGRKVSQVSNATPSRSAL